jgi:hypothetical protein
MNTWLQLGDPEPLLRQVSGFTQNQLKMSGLPTKRRALEGCVHRQGKNLVVQSQKLGETREPTKAHSQRTKLESKHASLALTKNNQPDSAQLKHNVSTNPTCPARASRPETRPRDMQHKAVPFSAEPLQRPAVRRGSSQIPCGRCGGQQQR